MRTSDLRNREEFGRILVETLRRGWELQHGKPVKVSLGWSGPGQRWAYQPILGAFIVPGAHASVRRFLKDSFRYTPRALRTVPQWLLGTALGSIPGLRLSRRAGFTVTPELPEAKCLLVMPGNQRVRVFDFLSRRVRVFLKIGFDARSLRTEVTLRASERSGPVPTIDTYDEQEGWFEENLLDAYTLPRCPPWFPRTELKIRALRVLEEWVSGSEEYVDRGAYVRRLVASVERGLSELGERFKRPQLINNLHAHLAWLGGVAADRHTATLLRSHGDFQPGNILVDRKSRDITLIDWEHSAQRSQYYDRFVLFLESRSAAGLASRIDRFVRDQAPQEPLAELPRAAHWRMTEIGMFLLEDLKWFLEESLSGPFTRPSAGLELYRDELNRLQPQWTHKGP